MKRIIVLIILFFTMYSAIGQELNVMSFNIRLNTAIDSINAWPFRKDNVAAQIVFHNVHLLGVQEALYDQVVDLQIRLPKFRYVGVGRDDGKETGEYSALFYDTTKLSLLQSATFWLSQTPDVAGSKGWDAGITRIVTWAKLRDKQTNKIFYAFNTHFDHVGKIARKESALLIMKKVKEIAGNNPVIITGDFNARPFEEPIQVITDPFNPLRFTDSKEISTMAHYGPSGTFNGFKSKERDDQPIDFIFIKNDWKVLKHATISQTWEGRFASDHFAVLATLSL